MSQKKPSLETSLEALLGQQSLLILKQAERIRLLTEQNLLLSEALNRYQQAELAKSDGVL